MNIAISPEELKRRLDTGETTFLFDLRNEDEFKSWAIEGRFALESLNIPQVSFVGEEEQHFGRFPRDRQIVAVCAHGDSSKYSAEILRDHGFDAVSLEGGMDKWSEFYETRKMRENPAIYQIYRVARGCISHLVVSGGDAIVIDAVRHTERILALASSLKATVTHVFDTHLQADHISGGLEIARKTGALYHMNPADAEAATYRYEKLKDGDAFVFGQSRIEVICSPGHTPGSTSFLLDGAVLFTGDTIMKTSVGRPDLGGKADEWTLLLHDTLFRKFGKLGDEILILPTHAASIREQDAKGVVVATLGEARRNKDLYGRQDLGEFSAFIKSSLPENPERYQDIRKVNLGLLDPDEAKRKELEIGKNLCGMAKKT